MYAEKLARIDAEKLAISNSRIPELQHELQKLSVVGRGGKWGEKAIRPRGFRKFRWMLRPEIEVERLVAAQLEEWKRIGLPHWQIKYASPKLVMRVEEEMRLRDLQRGQGLSHQAQNNSEARRNAVLAEGAKALADALLGPASPPLRRQEDKRHREIEILRNYGPESREWKDYLMEEPFDAVGGWPF